MDRTCINLLSYFLLFYSLNWTVEELLVNEGRGGRSEAFAHVALEPLRAGQIGFYSRDVDELRAARRVAAVLLLRDTRSIALQPVDLVGGQRVRNHLPLVVHCEGVRARAAVRLLS